MPEIDLFSLRAIEDPDRAEAAARALSGGDVPNAKPVPGLQEATELPDADLWEPPGPVGDAFYWDDADIVGIRGPVGSGKTTQHLRSRFRRAKMMPRSVIDGVRYYKVVIARETYRQLWATTIPSWWEVMPKSMGKWSGGRGDPVTHHIRFADEDGEVDFIAEFMAFGTSPAEIEANARGVQTTDMALEEADTVPVMVFTKGLTRIDRYPAKKHFAGYPEHMRSYGQMSGSYNSPDEENWTVRVLEGAGDDAEAQEIRSTLDDDGIRINFYRQPGYDEPGCENLQNLGPKYYPRAIAGMTAEGKGNDVERLVYNRIGYVRIGDPVFKGTDKHPLYVPNLHIARSPLKPVAGHPLRIGLDQGYYGAAVIGQFFEPFQWRIYGELWFKNGSFAPQFGMALKEKLDGEFAGFRVEMVLADIAGSSKESLEDVTWTNTVSAHSGLEIEPQPLGGNRVEPRLAVWRAAMQWNHFGTQGLIISPECKLLKRGLENDYVWATDNDKSTNRGRVPRKKGVRAADVIDAGGYMMLSESLPDGRPKTAALIGHNGGPPIDDPVMTDVPDASDDYDFDLREQWG
ncbi:hypothetical protein [Roseobacter sp.]|uniref:hypothetical protein n=1 Tax=Roseobacter sp. TaxID=1907202 RepID=UPI002966BA71|nr:hypothetical protein [Roseobacter sp.]MDW3181761.1 hypothetical protein [Roseobacter sp.]